ncbi:MAG TPA: hypothetical protein PK018_09230 [Candidatus Competibacter sp.]|nr:hypothetical protein [Candidatus Competibacteraceae bacterium]HPE72336.1 hypothetical protein [Candidatus Competibacter sp.]HRW66501.1 hypothetical protein [Candidatus Competibacter sp.]
MTYQKLFDEYLSLPIEAQQQVADFIAFLQQRYKIDRATKKSGQEKLESEPFIGMWSSRQDLFDSSNWIRKTRKSEWGESM